MPGYLETNSKRLVPLNSGHFLYDFTATGFGTIRLYGVSTVQEINVHPFAVSVDEDGVVLVSQPNGTESLNPTNGGFSTILTITQYRTCTVVNGTVVISPQKTGFVIKVKGDVLLTDTLPPTVTNISPSSGQVSTTQPITLTFSESIKRGTGLITIWNETLNSSHETFDMATAPTSGAGSIATSLNQMTFTTASAWPYNNSMSVRVAAGSIQDLNNNNIAAITGATWSFSTVPFVTPNTSFSPDVTVSSVASLLSTLQAWQSNPSGTAPSGKAPLDDRILGYNAPLGTFSWSNLNLPMKVYIRPVGTFGLTSINGVNQPTCSTYISGTVTLTGCTNIIFWRNDIRAPNTSSFFRGIFASYNCTSCGLIKSVVRGWPHALTQGTYGTTARGIWIEGGANHIQEHNVTLYCYDAGWYLDKNINGFTWRGNMGRHSGGNVLTFGGSTNTVSDVLMENNYMDRNYHPYKSLHGDWVQYNINATTNRVIWRRNVGYHGHWTGQYNPDSNGNVTNACQFLFCSQGNSASTGPNLFEHNLVVTAQQRGVDRIPGTAVLTTNNNTMLDSLMPTSPIIQGSPAPYPRIVSTNISNSNFITAPSSNPSYVVNEGTGGVRKVITASRAEILDEHMAIPTDLTDLYDIRPRVNTITHPSYSNPSARVGCYDLWGKLFLGDNQVVLSKQGWPVASIFIEDFDPLNRFISSYTGVFDANGDNA